MKRAPWCASRWDLSAPVGCLVLLAACGSGRDVDMGHITVSSSQAAPDSPVCAVAPCANQGGVRIFVEGGATDADADAFAHAARHPPGTDPSLEPVLLYPSDETLVPVTLSLLRFAWTPQEGARFALDFSGTSSSARVLTTATSFVANDEEWAWIARSNRGGRVEVVVRALDARSQDTWQSNSVELSFADDALDGSIYYWSTGSRGLMQARIDDARPVRVYSDPAGTDAGTCTGCHTISRDGTRLAFSSDKPELGEVSLPERMPLVPDDAGATTTEPAKDPKGMAMPAAMPIPASFSTFSPDGTLLLTAAHGKLRLVSSDTGLAISDPPEVALPKGTLATHPDWSPLGDSVAVTLATKGGDKQTEGGSIALLPYDGAGSFGTPDVIVPSQGGADNNYFPSFSPDGRFIAYVNAASGSQDASLARIRLIELASRNIIELTRLNERVGADDGLQGLGNSMPTWAPSTGGTYWLAFSSLRAYSDLRPADVKKDQLWIAGIDPQKPDPSFAAFWAPFQNIDQGNHRAFWTAPATLVRCGDTCSERETCGDGVDDDCDCVVDDCSEENCANGTDDDGDGHDDKTDPVCLAQKP